MTKHPHILKNVLNFVPFTLWKGASPHFLGKRRGACTCHEVEGGTASDFGQHSLLKWLASTEHCCAVIVNVGWQVLCLLVRMLFYGLSTSVTCIFSDSHAPTWRITVRGLVRQVVRSNIHMWHRQSSNTYVCLAKHSVASRMRTITAIIIVSHLQMTSHVRAADITLRCASNTSWFHSNIKKIHAWRCGATERRFSKARRCLTCKSSPCVW